MPPRTRAALRCALLPAAAAAALLLAGAAPSPDARDILHKVRQSYRALDHFHMEGVITVELHAAGKADQTFDSPFRVWAARPNRLRSELKNPMMGALYLSDGATLVTYAESFNQYTRRPLSLGGDSLYQSIPSAVNRYFSIDDPVEQTRYLRDQRIEVNGAPVDCAVLEVTYTHPTTDQQVSPSIFWIDRSRWVVARESVSVSAANPQGGTIRMVQSTRFRTVDLETPLADSTFAFQAPEGAKEVQRIGSRETPTTADLQGKPAPDFALADLTGRSVRLSTLRGKVVLLDFWATWCGPCRIEMPRVQKLHKDFRTRGLAVYGVNVGEEREDVRPYLKKTGYTFPILLDRSKKVMEKYQVTGIPTLVIVDRKGTIHSYFVGVREDSVLRNALADLGVK